MRQENFYSLSGYEILQALGRLLNDNDLFHDQIVDAYFINNDGTVVGPGEADKIVIQDETGLNIFHVTVERAR